MRDAVREKFRSLTRRSIKKAIGEREFLFYAFRPPMVAELLGLGVQLSSAIAAFTDKGTADRGFKNRTVTTDDAAGKAEQTDIEQAPASLEVIKFRSEQRAGAVKSVAEALLGGGSRNLLARLVADSLRDEFDDDGAKIEDVEAFWNSLDFGLAAEFVAAAMEANASVIRPLVEKVGLNLQGELKSILLGAVAETPAAAPALKMIPKPAPVPATETRHLT